MSYVLGGPAYRLMQRIGLIRGAGPSVLRRTIAFIAITWVPMLVFAALDGRAIGPTPRESFLLDFASYARFFLLVPLIFAAELVTGPRMQSAGRRLWEGGIVKPESLSDFVAAVSRGIRRREAWLPELICAVIAFVLAWNVSLDSLSGLATANASWHTVLHDGRMQRSAADLWYEIVAIPLGIFFVLRWVWRLSIWTLFLRDVSRLRLDLQPTHTDMAGGLGFLGQAHVSMCIFPLAIGCVLSAEIAFRMQFESFSLAWLNTMIPLWIVYLIVVEIVTFGSLVLFVPPMVTARRLARGTYGELVHWHNALFHLKWIEGDKPPDETPLGNADMSSLVDLGSSYAVVQEMRAMPVSWNQAIQVAAIASSPVIPLLIMVLPLAEAIKLIKGLL